ncbi:MAG TPA: dihydrofolate reductase family protein, partial [Ilumatobacteraceae bacterium]|nr:dihydrofolate reductase family protein [Ilumatobacteraceae bacterium]
LTADEVGWNTTLLPADDALGAIAELKQRDGGDLQVMGSSNLAAQLVAAGLVDVLRLMIEPVILGGGKRIFTDNGQASTWDLVEQSVSSTGVQICMFHFKADGVGSGSSDDFYE